jgi:AraC-like DNA-binding protein
MNSKRRAANAPRRLDKMNPRPRRRSSRRDKKREVAVNAKYPRHNATEPRAHGNTSVVKRRRRVDWPIILGAEAPVPTVLNRTAPEGLSSLLEAFDEILALEDQDAVLRRAVELARERIGLGRVGIFLLDRPRDLMLGTWGSDLHGGLVDEHHIMYGVSEPDREAFRRAEDEGARFTVFDNCPIMEHSDGQTAIRGNGWTVFTPIRSGRTRIGMLFNDAGGTDATVDPTRQAHAAILCALLGTLLDPIRGSVGLAEAGVGESSGRRLVTAAAAMIAAEPGIGGKEMASRLAVGVGRLTRAFRDEMGMSVVEYRNRLRLDRFSRLLQGGRRNLTDAARAAGFGSYAQFHRVFRAMRRTTPREYLRKHP